MNKAVEFINQHLNEEVKNSPSAFANWLGGKIIKAEAGHVIMQFDVRNDMTNPVMTLHGGVAAGIIDEVIGLTVFTVEHQYFFMTVNLHVNYFTKVNTGDVITADCTVVKDGKKIIHARCDLRNADGKTMVTGAADLLRTDKKIGFDF
ncbi:MAG TPA: PaaI family thioesterase [Bacteroidia bacterium]|nr:PaaI family thioesterase [Bacteroidia bacterium]HNU32376.1 PaaI family thioesterase [Bacteroidia bacterium]